MNIKPEQLVVGAELVCTVASLCGGSYTVGKVYTITGVDGDQFVVPGNGNYNVYWDLECLCVSVPRFEDWHTQFELKQKEQPMTSKSETERVKHLGLEIVRHVEKLKALTAELELKLEAEQKAAQVRTVSFATKNELAAALAEGRTFDAPSGMSLWYHDTAKGSPYTASTKGAGKDNGVPMNRSWDCFDNLIETTPEPGLEVLPWYLIESNFPVKCHVSDSSDTPGCGSCSVIINSYDTQRNRRFVDDKGSGWQYAIPRGSNE
jgi:hypothetical protein